MTDDPVPFDAAGFDTAGLDKAAFRAFVRDHHPDRGGDPEVFVAGLRRFRTESGHPSPDDARYDCPVEIVTPLPLPVRVAVALIRTVRKRRTARVE